MASSVATRSTTLTTAGHGSLRTQSSSESLSSDALSMSDLSSVLGKKRPLPLDILDVKSQVHTAEGITGGTRPRSKLATDRPSQHALINVASRRSREQKTRKVVDEEPDSTPSSTDGDAHSVNDRKPAYPKRRKVVLTPGRRVHATRPIRPRVARYATVPTRAQIPKPPKLPSSSSQASSRLQTRSATRSTGSAVPSDASQPSLSPNHEASSDAHVKVTRTKATKPAANVKSRQVQVVTSRTTSESEAT